MKFETIPLRVPGVRLEAVDGELLLYRPGATRLVRLNASAALVWELCDGQRSIAEIAEALAAAYPDHAAAISDDVSDMLQRLADEGVVLWA